ncbi:ferredoxin [Streptomyces sp. MB09-02B]|uniref:ferredoxin n=1 Tax=Streptomyces sp. MB09-02B TaxID=3028667 RepID=UPI0029BEFB6A|nr:ferredoxin [Streptomyces sp. MB09-02B]MDX3642276.1 ferredoxin [Streptomyces sp. MB09-02B]
MQATAQVDRTLCLGAGLCEVMGADLFWLDEEGIAVEQPAENNDDDRLERLREIADCCPTGAISIVTAEQ